MLWEDVIGRKSSSCLSSASIRIDTERSYASVCYVVRKPYRPACNRTAVGCAVSRVRSRGRCGRISERYGQTPRTAPTIPASRKCSESVGEGSARGVLQPRREDTKILSGPLILPRRSTGKTSRRVQLPSLISPSTACEPTFPAIPWG